MEGNGMQGCQLWCFAYWVNSRTFNCWSTRGKFWGWNTSLIVNYEWSEGFLREDKNNKDVFENVKGKFVSFYSIKRFKTPIKLYRIPSGYLKRDKESFLENLKKGDLNWKFS